MNDLLQAVAAEWGQGSQEHNIARDVCKLANWKIEAQAAEIQRLREALKRIARYDVGLQSLIEDGADTPENRAKYYEGRVEYRRSIARAALPETDETFTHPDNV
jgi:hypothetical protein